MLSFLPSCYSSYGAWTFTPVGLAPTDHASLRWTHRFSLLIWNSVDVLSHPSPKSLRQGGAPGKVEVANRALADVFSLIFEQANWKFRLNAT